VKPFLVALYSIVVGYLPANAEEQLVNDPRSVQIGDKVRVVAQPGFADLTGQMVSRDEEGGWLIADGSDRRHVAGSLVRFTWAGSKEVQPLGTSPLPPSIVRTYKGSQQADTLDAFQREAQVLSQSGYEPTSQSWAPGQWGAGAFLVALLLFVIVIGILVFLYMLIVKPDGTLTVTFTRRGDAGVPAAAANPLTLTDRLSELERALGAGVLTSEEYERKRAEIIDSA
jgi:hypothetical protein